MSTSVLVRGRLHQRHSRVPTNDATSSHRLHSIERDQTMVAGGRLAPCRKLEGEGRVEHEEEEGEKS